MIHLASMETTYLSCQGSDKGSTHLEKLHGLAMFVEKLGRCSSLGAYGLLDLKNSVIYIKKARV
jgi:hypothetical protein